MNIVVIWSHPSRGVWIEMANREFYHNSRGGRTPRGVCGLK